MKHTKILSLLLTVLLAVAGSTSVFAFLSGDMDGNGSINVNDLNTVWNAKNYNKSAQDPTVDSITDIDGNGSINVNDLNIVWNSANYNKGEKDCTISYL